MGKLVIATRQRFDASESLRMALLSGASVLLGLTFLLLLAADQARAAL